MKFFVTTISSWESLAVVTKKSILVPKDVLDMPMLEIEMSKLNKHHISARDFNKYFCCDLIKYEKLGPVEMR